MNYKGKELKEANGAEYPLTLTTHEMLVWRDGEDVLYKRGVLGFFQGFWITPNIVGKGVIQWYHAAEIPAEEETLLTNRELSRWLAQGKGEVLGSNKFADTAWNYPTECSNMEVREGCEIRKWDDEEWHKPTREYAFGKEDA